MGIIWTIIIGFCGGGDREISSSWKTVRATGVYLDNPARHRGGFRRNIPWPSNRLVQSWRKRWAHRSSRRRNHSVSGVGPFRTSESLISLGGSASVVRADCAGAR